jgi:lysophospholipase L1-like esterase
MSLGSFLTSLGLAGLNRTAIDNARRPRRQVVATRGRFPITTDGAGANGYSRFESNLIVQTGPRPFTNLQVLFSNRYSGSGGEYLTDAADFTLESAVYQNGIVSPISFQGRKTPVVSGGASLIESDRHGFLIPAGSQLHLRTGGIITSGLKLVVGQPGSAAFTRVASTSATSQIYGSGGITVPSGGAATTFGLTPLAVLGVPDRRHVAVMIWGDSIAYGSGDGNGEATYGHVGWAERSLISVNGSFVPFVNCSRAGDRTAGYNFGFSWGRIAVLEFVTHAVFTMGINDIAAAVTLATMQANCQAIWAAARQMGVKAYHTTLTPYTTSTDGWTTAANQTVVSGYGVNEIRGQFNAWLDTQVAVGNLDGKIDVNASVEDPANPGKWKTSAGALTADGLHPNTAGHVAMAAVGNAAASTWTV